mgnify:CR=1 FL=1
MSDYDLLAASYDAALHPVPEEYVRLIQIRFHLRPDDRVIDLGCGSGYLTFELARFSSYGQGLDLFKEMIKIAKGRDVAQSIQWIDKSVEQFDFGFDRYRLIIGFESFHAFLSGDTIRRCELALKQGGYLALGWITHHWEASLQHIVTRTFASRGICWGNWDYNTCPDLPRLVQSNASALAPLLETGT